MSGQQCVNIFRMVCLFRNLSRSGYSGDRTRKEIPELISYLEKKKYNAFQNLVEIELYICWSDSLLRGIEACQITLCCSHRRIQDG